MDEDRMLPAPAERRALPVRAGPAPRELTLVRARADVFEQRLEESRIQFRLALERFSDRAAELNPSNRVRERPWEWVLGAFAVGLVLGIVAHRTG